ncbi:hypothetical protein C7271_17420 [filamentous cyanobacterium CCP5]|nr:hypothetical protein C7271_17420 [filamentous cyanobacterium CCP5]
MGNLFEQNAGRILGVGLVMGMAIALQPPGVAQPTLDTALTDTEPTYTSYQRQRRSSTYIGGTGRRQIL